jgi:HAD superfamily hydrolase (TIGR01509 family)
VEVYPGSVALLRKLRERKKLMAVVSSSNNCEEVLEAAGIADFFAARVDGIVATEKGLHGKPAPDTFLHAVHTLDVSPKRAVVVEDALAGVEAGRAGGFGLVVGVDRRDVGAVLRQHGADILVSDLAELIPG